MIGHETDRRPDDERHLYGDPQHEQSDDDNEQERYGEPQHETGPGIASDFEWLVLAESVSDRAGARCDASPGEFGDPGSQADRSQEARA